MSTREDWLTAAAQFIYDTLISPIAVVQSGEKWAVSCGFPSVRATSQTNRRLGECWAAEACEDNSTRHIFISPVLTELVDGTGQGVLPTLVHELIHVVSPEPGHRGEFRRIGKLVGLEGRMTASIAGQALADKLNAIAAQLGPYPHAAIVKLRNARKVQSTRMIKCEAINCTACSYVVRTTRIWLTEFGPPKCPHGSVMVEVASA